MKKRFTMLLASLFLSLGTAWAYQLSYDKTFWTVPATNHEKVTEVPADVFTVYSNNYQSQDITEALKTLPADKVGVFAEEVNAAGGDVTVALQYVSGNGSNIRLDICGVDLVATDGSVVYQDYHFGWAGGNPSNNTYTLSGVEKGSYTLRVFVASQREDFTNNANNSRGNMTVTGAERPIVGSTAENKIFYYIKNVRSGKYANYEGAGVQFTQIATPTFGSYWYLLEVADAESVPEGYKAYRLYNAANALAVENPSSGNMTANEGVQWPAKVYCIGEHTNGGLTGVVIRPINDGDSYSSWNDAGGNGEKIGHWTYDDPGSIWSFERVDVTESQLIQNAVALKANAVSTLTTEKVNTERYFYGYEPSSIEAKEAEVEAIAVPESSLVEAMTGAINISKIDIFAGLERIAPKAGDKFTMVNRGRNSGKDGLVAFAAGTDVKCLQSPFPYFDAVWTLVATGTEGQFKLYNEKLKVYVGVLSDANNTKFQYVTGAEEAGVYELANVEGYATFKKVGGDNKSHLHQSNWGGKEIVRWDNGDCSQWQLVKPFGPELTTDANNPICYALKSGRDGNYYFTLDNNKVKLFNNKSIATEETTHWYFMLDGDGLLKMYSKSDNKAMGYLTGTSANTRLTNDVDAAEYDNNTYILYFAPYNQADHNGAWFALKPSRNDTYVSNHGGTANYMGFHTAFDDGGTRIAFENVDRMRLEAKVAECEAKVVGDAIGYYSVSGGDAAAVLAAAKAALQGTNSAAYRNSLAALEALTYTLNVPEVGKYYRIKGKTSGNYIDAAGQVNAQMNMKETPDPLGSIFLLDEGNRLKNMSTDTYVYDTHSIGETKENANTWEFILSSIGYLKLKSNIGSPWLHDSGSKADRCSSDGPDHEFVVEEVTAEELNAIILNGGFTYVTALGENSNHPVIVNNARSNWAVADNPTALNTLAKLGLAKEVLDTKQQFAFITPDEGENYYLYSVHAKRYLKSNNTFGAQGEPIQFKDASSLGENRVQVQFRDIADKFINVGGSNQVTIDWWSTIDEGNACEMVQCNTLTFDLDEALNIFNNGADITLTYKLGDKLVSTTTYETQGETYSFSNPYAFTTVTSCKKDGKDLEATEGTYSFEVAGDAHIVVELQENLPFRYAASYDKIEYWYFMKIRDDNFTYMGYDAEKAYIRANQSTVPTESKDAYTWGFVGNLLEGFSIVNYATGKTKVLSAPVAPNGNQHADQLARMVEVTKEYNGNLVWNIKAPTHDNPKPDVFYIEHPTATSYAFNRQGYEGANAVCYWTGRDTGSAIQVEERGVFNLSDLKTDRVYALQAERSPLMYSATEGMTTKLSSGMVDGVSADASETNQQFLIIRSKTEGEYYLYSVGAKMFVDANLNFTYYPEPVLSFEANEKVESKNLIYPWYVKIAGKYVAPGGGGTAGNKLFHTSTPDEDDGKRYRIVNAGAYDASAVLAVIKKVENLVESTADLSNSKVYTVTPKANATTGVWDVKYDDENATMLAITKFTGNAVDPANSNQQFAFLTVNGEHYLYSYGAKKFVAKNEGGQMLTDELSSACRVEFLTSTIASEQKLFPLVVKVGGSQLHSSYQNHLADKGGIITTWDHTESGGNAVAIVAVDGTVDLSEAIAKVEAYQLLIFTSELENLIDEAQALLDKGYLDTEDAGMLTSAKEAAEIVYNNPTAATLKEQIDLLGEAIDAVTYVREVEDFKNAYVYTFVSKRGWMGADGTDGVISGTGAADNTNYQWAVYKSERGYSYLYNIGKAQFMGVETRNNTQMPFSATPQTTGLTFKKSAWTDYPIMFSMDNQYVVNNNKAGQMICWTGGWNNLEDDGSNHQVAIVGALAEETLKTIAEAVNRYEAIQALETAIAAAQAKVAEMSDAIGYYSSSIDNVDTKLKAIVAFKEDITESTTVPEIEEQTAAAEVIIASFSLNLPETGKYYRFKHPTEDAYMLSDDYSENNNRLAMGDNKVSSIFYYGKDGALLSYANGCYLPKAVLNGDWTCLPAGTIAPPAATFGGGTTIGRVGFYVGDAADRAYYSGRVTYVDAGGNFGSDEGYDWIVEEVTTLPLKVSAVGYASFYTPVEVTLPDGIAAYAIEEGKITQDNEDGTVKLSDPITVIPANTGVILYANGGGDFELDITNTKAQALEGNLLSGASAKTLVEGDAYVLANKARGIGLYPVALTRDKSGATGGTTHFLNGANKAYLPKNVITTSNVRSLIFRFGDTGVEDMQAVPQHTLIYDLMGRPVERMEKGIYIVNGRKVVK